MACSDFSTYKEFIDAGQFWDAIVCPYADQMGMVVFALVVYAAIAFALYYYSETVMMPLVLTIILGSVVIVKLPGIAVQLAAVVLLLILALAGYLLVIKSGPARQ